MSWYPTRGYNQLSDHMYNLRNLDPKIAMTYATYVLEMLIKVAMSRLLLEWICYL